MLENFNEIWLLTALVYAFVESLEKFGVSRKYAHLLAIPIGVIISFLQFSTSNILNKIFYGVIIGVLSVGTCDISCNIVDTFNDKSNKS
ncbi:hypothetical protein DIC82_14735 [Clostridium beijerinckii]|nr:hypothetical protein DIC82_14735 [Clostridium beijerinckii]